MDNNDYYQVVDKINKGITNRKEVDNYIENVLDGTFDYMESSYFYLKVEKFFANGNFKASFRLNEDTTVESLKADIKRKINDKMKFYQKLLEKI